MSALTFLIWLGLVLLAGWSAFPLSRRVFGAALPDAGLAVGRIVWLAAWTMLAFWLGQGGVAIGVSAWAWAPLALVGLAVGWRDRAALAELWRRRKRALIATEALFLAVFLGFFLLRGFWSDANGTNGEKSMDSALIGSLARAQRLPPPNPYAAGARLQSYYYFGHLETALLTRASGTSVRWSYNLMCATLPALCFAALFSLGGALTASLRGGAWVMLAVAAGGTLQPLYQWTHPDAYSPSRYFGLDPFAISRVLPFSINEFPWFTFNQADLHGHYFDFSLEIALMALGWTLFRAKRGALAGLATLVLGAQIVTNTWDFPAYALLLGLSIIALPRDDANETLTDANETPSDTNETLTDANETPSDTNETPNRTRKKLSDSNKKPSRANKKPSRANKKPSRANKKLSRASKKLNRANETLSGTNEMPRVSRERLGWERWAVRGALALAVVGGALLLAAPFIARVQSGATPPQRLPQPASPLREWLLLWGPIALAWWAFSALATFRRSVEWQVSLLLMGAGIVLAAVFSTWAQPSVLVLPIIGASAAFALAGMLSNRGTARFLCLLALCGLLAIGWSETTWAGFLGNPDAPKIGDSIRQDTVFKFGLQGWMLWGTASAAGVWLVVARANRALKNAAMAVAFPLTAVMLLGNALFMLHRIRFADMVGARRAGDPNWLRFDGWDAWAHLAPPEKAAAAWLQVNVAPGENIVEAENRPGGDYTEFTRYAHATGIPTIIGPQSHSYQWSPANAVAVAEPAPPNVAPIGVAPGDDTRRDDPRSRARDAKNAREWDEVFRRKAEVQRIYSPVSAAERDQLLRRYSVKYLLWGELERREYGDALLLPLSDSLSTAAQFGAPDDLHRVTIFRVEN